eukprot:EG_transcript_231
MAESRGGCDVFINLALTQMAEYCGSQRRLARVKESSQALLEAIATKRLQQHTAEAVAAYVEPFKLACDSAEPRLVVLALDGLQKLMAYNIIRNDCFVPTRRAPDGTLRQQSVLGMVVDTLRACAKIPNEPQVQLQIIRCALTAVTDCQAHDNALLSLMTVLFDVMIQSREPVNQMTARAHLTQVINFAFNRLETARAPDPPAPAPPAAVVSTSPTTDPAPQPSPDAGTPRSAATDPVSPHDGPATVADGSDPTQPLAPCPTDPTSGTAESSAPAHSRTASTDTQPPSTVDAPAGNSSPTPPTTSGARTPKGARASQPPEVRDVVTIFSFLCTKANVDVTEDTPSDSARLRKCLRALEWIHKILQSAGPAFRGNVHVLHGLREPLTHALLKTCLSSAPGVFKLSLDIVVTMICHFKRYLKNEVGLLLRNVFLWLLESANTQYGQKLAVLQALQQVCRRSQVLVDIFINYDCCVNSPNILERIVVSMSKMVQTEHLETNWITPKEASTLRELSLQTLVQILASLVHWVNRFSPNPPPDDDGSCEGEFPDPGGPPSPRPQPVSERLERQRLVKLEVQKGVAEFNKKPKKGIQFWMEKGLLSDDPKEVGVFLRTTMGIDKQVLGDYLGGEDEFNRKVLLAYVETIDFVGLSIDDALRKFLSVFALPGEGQKIERILEQFSEAFLRCDQSGICEVADAVYILAVAIVMLNTDLHNPQVRDKMSKAQFLSQLKGINNGKDLSQPYLEGIYDRIEKSPFTNDEVGASNSAAAAEALALLGTAGSSLFLSKKVRKQMQYTVESHTMLKQTKELLEQRSHSAEVYYAANDISYVRPIFSVIWAPTHAAFSTSLEEATEPTVVQLCLQGFEHGIHIAALFEMPTEREAFISALSKMTYINNLRQISQKNIDCIQALIRIAHREGDLLQNSWLEVIRTISQLERLQVVGRAATPSAADPGKPMDEQNAVTIATKIDDVAINKVFAGSVHLSHQGIANFVQCLCQVCIEELLVNAHPRWYCLQKVVEVATDNLGERIVCIWSCIASTYAELGCRGKPQIASMAIDSLRQLVMKCLDQPELLEIQLQPEFLAPFHRILAHSAAVPETRDLVLRCFDQIVRTKAPVLHGGWAAVFAALDVAAADPQPDIVGLGWQMLRAILADCFPHLADHLVLPKAIHAVYSFAASEGAVGQEALKFIPAVADRIRQCTAGPTPPIAADHAQALWLCLLHDVALLSFHAKAATRQAGLHALREVLDAHGDALAPATWPAVFRTVLFDLITRPLFPDYHSQQPIFVSRAQWIATTAAPAFQLLGHVYGRYAALEEVGALLPEVLRFHVRIARQADRELIRVATTSYCHLYNTLATQWTAPQWDVFTETLQSLIHASVIKGSYLVPYMSASRDGPAVHLPTAPAAPPADRRTAEEETFPSQAHLLAHLLAHAHRQQAVVTFLEGALPACLARLSPDNVACLLDSLYTFYASVCSFHSPALASWRLALWLSGSNDVELLTALLQIQSQTLRLYATAAFQWRTLRDGDEATERALVDRCQAALQHFADVDRPADPRPDSQHAAETRLPHHLTEAHHLAPVVAAVVAHVSQWEKPLFLRSLPQLHPVCLDLILCHSAAVRAEVRRYFAAWAAHTCQA